MNMWVEQFLRHYVEQQGQADWVQFLPIAKFTHNSWPHYITKKTPHKLLFGIRPQIHITTSEENRSPTATEGLIQLQQARLHAAQALLK